MSTKFAPGKKSNKRPAVCHSGLIGLPVAYVGALPTSLVAFASWGETSGHAAISESFRLIKDPHLPNWMGSSGQQGLNLQVEVDLTAVPNVYDITLSVRDGGSVLASTTWADVEIPQGPPFNSGELTNQQTPITPANAVHVLD